MSTPYRIGVDLGGTKVEVALLGPDRKLLLRERTSSRSDEGYEAMLSATAGVIDLARNDLPRGAPYTIGVGIPGAVNPFTGLIQNANSTCLIDRPFKEDLETAVGRALAMQNDANCFTLAEALEGAGKGFATVFGVIMGTGCGGGICMDGRIHQGMHSIGGEWGHMVVDPLGTQCYCGNRGCVETLISGTGVEHHFLKNHGRPLDMRSIVSGFRSGDPDCLESFERFLDDFGRCLAGPVSLLDPDVVVLGGGLSNIEELYGQGKQLVYQYAFHPDPRTPVLKNTLGDSAGVFGAAWIGI